MNKKTVIIILLAFMLPMRELYRMFPRGVEIYPFPLNGQLSEFVSWYITDIVRNTFLFIILFSWFIRELSRDFEFAMYIGAFMVFAGMDLVLYLLNHSHVGYWYLFVYIAIIFYAFTFIFKKRRNERIR